MAARITLDHARLAASKQRADGGWDYEVHVRGTRGTVYVCDRAAMTGDVWWCSCFSQVHYGRGCRHVDLAVELTGAP